MNKSEHTPGPWTFKGINILSAADPFLQIGTLSRVCLTRMVNGEPKRHEITEDQREANARLIASAPDLLEVMRLIDKGLRQRAIPDQTLLHAGKDDSCLDMTPLSKIVSDAIAKATGNLTVSGE